MYPYTAPPVYPSFVDQLSTSNAMARAAELDAGPSHPYRGTGLRDELMTAPDDDATACGCCATCGQESSGTTLAGYHVPLCDGCLIRKSIGLVGNSMAREAVEELSWDGTIDRAEQAVARMVDSVGPGMAAIVLDRLTAGIRSLPHAAA